MRTSEVKDIEKAVQEMVEWSNLTELVPQQGGREYLCTRFCDMSYAFSVSQTVFGIVITGNMCRYALMATKLIAWFGGTNMSPDYLAGKFLKRSFTVKAAIQDVLWEAEQCVEESEDAIPAFRLADDLTGVGKDEALLLIEESGIFDPCDSCPGYAYDFDEVVALCAMQRIFSKLWNAQ